MRSAILLVLSAALLMSSCAVAPQPTTPNLRVLAYNVRHGLGMDGVIDLERLAAVIRAERPDVVTLQEIDRECERSEFVDQARVFGEACGMRHVFGEFMPYDGGHYGMAVLSRLPIVEATNVVLPAGAEPRSALEVVVQLEDGGPEVIVTGIHLYRTDSERLAQARVLFDRYAGESRAVILAGDFNSEPGSAVLQLLAGRWNVCAKEGAADTFPADAPVKEIDFVLVPRDRDIVAGRHVVVDERVASDHRPIVAELSFPAR